MDNYDIKEWKAVVVDGEAIKADTWYTLVGGEMVEIESEKIRAARAGATARTEEVKADGA